MSVSRQTTSRSARRPELEHRLGEHLRVLERLHEGAVADLHVEDDRVRAAGDLLRHDARRDQGHDVDGPGDVAQAVELLVGRDEVGGLADDRQPDLAHLLDELVDRRARRRNPGIDSSLSSVPPVCPSPRPLIFPTGTPQAATIGPTAIEVLSPTPPVECLSTTRRPSAEPRSSVVAASDHRVREGERLGAGEAAEVDGHAPRRELVVGHLAARVAEDQLRDLVGRELLAVPLALDQLRRADHRVSPRRRSWRGGSRSGELVRLRLDRARRAASESKVGPSRRAVLRRIVTQPSASRRSTLVEVPCELLGAVLAA